MALAGRAKEEFGELISVETVYKGFLTIGGRKDIPDPPQLQVGTEFLGPKPTYDEVRRAITRQLGGD